MFPWLIWLCMAETAKGTVSFPLSSSDYIQIGTSHLHRYYGAIRLPIMRLFPSFRCVHIPRFTRLRGHNRLSPVDIAALYSMNRSPTPPPLMQAHPIASTNIAFRVYKHVGLRDRINCFGAQYYPCCLTSYALFAGLPLFTQGCCRRLVRSYRAGFAPAGSDALCWAHCKIIIGK